MFEFTINSLSEAVVNRWASVVRLWVTVFSVIHRPVHHVPRSGSPWIVHGRVTTDLLYI